MRPQPPDGFRCCSRCGRLKPASRFRKRRLPSDRRLDSSACVTCNGDMQRYVATQQRAHRLVRRAILSGKIVRPDRCTECRKVRLLEAHHWRGYRFPLTVRWLCRSCHRYAEGPERMSFGVRLWCYGVRRRIKVDGRWLVWWKDAGWTFWWIDVPTRQYWGFARRFTKYQQFEWVNRELLEYRYAEHLAAVRVELYRAPGNTAKLQTERRRLRSLRERVGYWETRSRKRRQLIADGKISFG